MPNPRNGRRQELAPADARLAAESGAAQAPAFRFNVRRSLRMHPLLAALVAGAVFLLLVLYALSRKPVYSAESLIYIEPLEVRVLSDGSSSGYDPSRYDSYLQQQVQTVERADTLEAALAKLPPGMWSAPGENSASAVARLEGALKVERVLNSYQLAIDVKTGSAEAAAASANAVTSAYLEEGRKDEHLRADQRLQLLTEERDRITQDMTEDKAEQASLGTSLGVANPTGASGNPYDVQSEGLRSQLAAAREAHDTVAAQLASVSGANGTGLDTAANELITTDPGLVSIKQTLSQRRAVLSDQMAGLTTANPVYRQDQEEIGALDRSMDRATAEARQRAERQLQDKLRLDLQRTADVEGRLNAQLAEQTAKATGAGPKLQRAAELDTDLQRLSARFATVDDAIRGLQLETSGPGQAHLVLAARAPGAPDPSRTKLILLLALPLALLCGIAAAVIARKRDQRLYLAGDLQDVLGFAPLCVLPNAGEVSGAAYDDFLLRLAGGLEGAYRHGNARSFVFTPVSVSASTAGLLPKLRAKLQQIGFRAGCVDADELMPSGSPPVVRGSGAALEEEASPVREGVGATRMERLLQEHDLVLIQAPPLLGSALTEYAVRCADATILLVESTRTDRDDLRRAAALLERLNPQGVGAVLEDMPLRYADSGFRDAVRAADHSPRPGAERRDDVRPAPEQRPEPHAEPKEVFSMATRHGSRTTFEEVPGSAAFAAADACEATALRNDTPEPLAPLQHTQEITAAEPVIEAVPAEEPVAVKPLPAPGTTVRIFFNEATPAEDAEDGKDDTWSWTSRRTPVAPAAAEWKPAVQETATVPVDSLAVEDRSEPKAVRGWSAWKHADTVAESVEPAAVEPMAAIPESEAPPTVQPAAAIPEREPGTPDAKRGEWSARVADMRQSPFLSAESMEPLVATPRKAIQSAPKVSSGFLAEPAAAESKPTGWWRRLLRLTEEPTLRIVPDHEGPDENQAEYAGSPASTASVGLMEAPVVSAEESAAPSIALDNAPFVAAEAEPQEHSVVFGEPASASEDATQVTQTFAAAAPTSEALVEPDNRVEPVEQLVATSEVSPAHESGAEKHAYVAVVADSGRSRQLESEPAAIAEPVFAEPVLVTEGALDARLPVGAVLAVQAAPAPRAASAKPLRAEVEPQRSSEADSAAHVAADPKGPLGTFPRPRTSPITIAAIPSMVTSVASARREQETVAAEIAKTAVANKEVAKAEVANRSVQASEPVAQSVPPPHRPGLAKAIAQVATDDGPPARASEGLTAMRTGAGLRKAIVRGEAVLRSQTNTPEIAAQPTRPGMSRRWGMLSRFERSDEDIASADLDAQTLAQAAALRVRAEEARNSRV